MRVNATDIKNNLGEYLRRCEKEDVIITRHGKDIAVLKAIDDTPVVCEKAVAYDIPRDNEPIAKMTYEEYRKFMEGKDEHDQYELIDGFLYHISSPNIYHQHALSRLHVLFSNWLEGKKCDVYFSPFDIVLNIHRENPDVVQPDLMVICDLDEHLDEDGYYRGVPSLVLEILSSSSKRKDMLLKLNLYMQSGVKEYWVVNPINKEITVYMFENKDIKDHKNCVMGMACKSFIFEGLEIKLENVFK